MNVSVMLHRQGTESPNDGRSTTRMSDGNALWRKGDLNGAMLEYQKIASDSPLFAHAQFNMRIIERALRRDLRAVVTPRTGAMSGSFEGLQLSRSGKQGSLAEGPLLSIVMPVYNVATYLDTSIVSALNQSFKDFELIIVNDASTDGCRQIIDMHASQDARIRAVHLEHNTLGGAGIPSNIGLRMARGAYIGFIDSDDWVTGEAFSEMLALAREHDADVVIGDFRTFTEDDRVVSPPYDEGRYKGPFGQVTNATETPSLLHLSPVPWRKIYKRSFMEQHGIAYPEGDYFYEDNPLHWFVLTRARRVLVTSVQVSYHRMGRAGQTMTAADYKLGALCSHMNTVACFLNDQADLRNDKVIVKEFYDYCFRNGWIHNRQERNDVKALIGKRIAQIVAKNQDSMPFLDVRRGFSQRIAGYAEGYPEYDLTVVIPTYNCEAFVEETINCALNVPGIATNVLVIDDGSEDGTAAICQRLERAHDNLHFFQQKNRGAGRARNAVIPLCTGLYTFFLDADDVIDGEQLSKAVLDARKRNNDLYFMKYKIEFHEAKQVRDMFNADKALWAGFRQAKNNNELRRIAASLINYPWNRIIKTELLHNANIFFGATVVHNDIAFHWESLLAARNIGYGEGEVCTHRKFEQRGQITNVSDHRRLAAFDALEATHHRIVRHDNAKHVIAVWTEFATHLVEWVRDRVPESLQPQYEVRKTRLLNLLASHQEEGSYHV
jgi:glycosyltransferase involved in cell wall biosynthesis